MLSVSEGSPWVKSDDLWLNSREILRGQAPLNDRTALSQAFVGDLEKS